MQALRWLALALICVQTKVAAKMAISVNGKDIVSEGIDKSLKPVELTARNFSQNLNDGNVWLIEFYSPHCVHCIEFAETYADIAATYHSSQKHKIKVGKVNGNEERALQSRFSIYAYPSFFIVDGFRVYEFVASRTKKKMMMFAEGGYKTEDPIPFYSSPMGPMGLLQGALISGGVQMMDLFTYSQETFGFSPMVTAGILFGCLFMGCFVLIVLLAVVVTPKVKTE
jgi:thiol-disulfide isomerase/thioredoxin